MKRALVVTVLALVPFLFSVPLFAQKKACEELKSEIAAKLDAKGVKNYTLTIVDEKDVKETDKVVGSCEAGTKRITYTRE
jgi:ABC-type Na+ efflux pump permease subunit